MIARREIARFIYWVPFMMVLMATSVTMDDLPALSAVERVDVLVIGGTPEGIAAGVAAARSGQKVLLVERSQRLGGILVAAGLNTVDLNWGPDGRLLNGGIFGEWYGRVEGDSFDIATAERAFISLVRGEERLRTWMETEVTGVERQGRLIKSVVVRHGARQRQVLAERYIDATEDADVAASAGLPFTIGREDYTGRSVGQAATLVFRLRGVDWRRAAAYLHGDGNPESDATERSLWGYGSAMQRYRPAQSHIGVRGLNVGRMNDGTVLINGLWIFGVDPLSDASRRQGIAIALKELPTLIPFIRANCPGFEHVSLVGTAERLYIRESRHLADPLYQLTIDDVLENRDQPDAVAHGSYPVDVQAAAPGESVQIVGSPKRYAVPLRSLISRSVDNLLIASRSAGYSSLAHGSVRTIPIGMATGQAAGVAASLSLERGDSLPNLASDPALVGEVQEGLRRQGVRLVPFQEGSPLADHPHADDARYWRRRGLVAAGYQNQYQLDEPVVGRSLLQFLEQVSRLTDRTFLTRPSVSDGPVTIEQGASALIAAFGVKAQPAQPASPLTWGRLYRLARLYLDPKG